MILGVSFKMYFGWAETLDWCKRLRANVLSYGPSGPDGVELFVLPSSPMLRDTMMVFGGTHVSVGAQNAHWSDRGPFTGEVSPALLAELGCRYVAIGHAERRRLFGETDDDVALKVAAALRHGLSPIICIGEETPGRTAARRCVAQLERALSRTTTLTEETAIVVAYEPQWAIGAERPAGPTHINHVCDALQDALRRICPYIGAAVVYGGAAGPGMMAALDPSVDGLFLGRRAHNHTVMGELLREALDLRTSRARQEDVGGPAAAS